MSFGNVDFLCASGSMAGQNIFAFFPLPACQAATWLYVLLFKGTFWVRETPHGFSRFGWLLFETFLTGHAGEQSKHCVAIITTLR